MSINRGRPDPIFLEDGFVEDLDWTSMKVGQLFAVKYTDTHEVSLFTVTRVGSSFLSAFAYDSQRQEIFDFDYGVASDYAYRLLE